MGSSLTGTKINQTYDSLIKVSDNGALDGTLQTLTDGLGNDSALSLSTAGASVTGTLAVSGATTLSGGVSGNVAFDTNTLFVDASSNEVGIGTISPSTTLEVSSSSLNNIFVTNPDTSGATTGSGIGFKAYNGSSVVQSAGIILTSGTWSFGTYSANQLSIGSDGTGGAALRTANSAPITFHTGGATAGVSTERMRIDSSGNVGIGIQAPEQKLTVAGGNLTVSGNTDASRQVLLLTTASTVATIEATYQGVSSFGDLAFKTSSTERMRITSGGYLKASNDGTYRNSSGPFHELVTSEGSNAIVELTNSNDSNPYGVTMYFSDADPNNATNYVFGAYASTSSTWMYRIFSNGTVAARSDIRLKKNIEPARSGYLQDLCQLEVVKYNWYNNEDGSPKEIGLIAQQVETVFPNLVITDKIIKTREVEQEDGTIIEEKYEDGDSKSIKQSVLPFMLLKAIQEQQEIINDLKARIETLENA